MEHPETTQSIYASNGGSYSLSVDLGNSCPVDTENIEINTIPNSQSSTEITICDDLLPYSWNGLTFNSKSSQPRRFLLLQDVIHCYTQSYCKS